MLLTIAKKRSRKGSRQVVQKASGRFQPRVQQVGPEHFALVCVDCAKARSCWMLADYYGRIIIAPKNVAHNRVELDAMVAEIQRACSEHDLRDCIVAVERTGRYHRPVQQACMAAKLETRVVHPFATKQQRQPADPGNKTDVTDLMAIHRAAVNGFALAEMPLSEADRRFQLLCRHRRDWVRKNSILCCQIREHLEAAYPGYAACFDKFWESELAWTLLRQLETPEAIRKAGSKGLAELLIHHKIRYQKRSLDKVVQWAASAAAGEVAAHVHRRIALDLNKDRLGKTTEIKGLEREIAHLLVQTPYILLLSIPGVNVVSASEYGGELGPITHYANSRCITGRAGLYPSRYQSDQVDHANGPLVRCCNRRMRAVILGIADNLIRCNKHFQQLATGWAAAGKDPRISHVKVGLRFTRMSYQIVAGRQLCRHPAMRQTSYVLDKLLAFHREHDTPLRETMTDLELAIAQTPKKYHQDEAKPFKEEFDRIDRCRSRKPELLGDIIVEVLQRLGVNVIKSSASGDSPQT